MRSERRRNGQQTTSALELWRALANEFLSEVTALIIGFRLAGYNLSVLAGVPESTAA
jgi:hypothetical protein